MFNDFFFFAPKIVPLMGNVEEFSRGRKVICDSVIQRIRFACLLSNATDTNSEYVILLHGNWLSQREIILLLYLKYYFYN
jgi:hypothetical protein